jgi:hypothetical protein
MKQLITIILILLCGVVSVFWIVGKFRANLGPSEAEKQQIATAKIRALAAKIDDSCARSGRYPLTVAEFEALADGADVLTWGKRVEYRRKSGMINGYYLSCLTEGGMIIQYDSTAPEKGVIRIPF